MAKPPSILFPFHSFLSILFLMFSMHTQSKNPNGTQFRSFEVPEESLSNDGQIRIAATSSPWNQLDKDILDLIIGGLDLFSRVRFSAVCKSWRSAIQEFPNPKQYVWQLFRRDPLCEYLTFLDLHTGVLHKLELPESVRGKWCWCQGSSDGRWIVVITVHRRRLLRNFVRISLFDPISRIELKLPKFGSGFRPYSWKNVDAVLSHYINKFEVFSLDGSQHIVAAIFDKYALAFCKLGGKGWHRFEQSYDYIDVCFLDGILYVLFHPDPSISENNENDSFDVVVQTRSMKFAGHEVILKLIPNSSPKRGPVTSTSSSQVSIDFCNISSLVKFNGELLRVQKLFNVSEIYDQYHGTRCFKFEPSRLRLSKFELTSDDYAMTCTKLGSLGDQALLIAKCTTACIVAENLKGVEKNCIHFLEDFEFSNPTTGIPMLCRACGVFHRDNGRIYHCLLAFQPPSHCIQGWFLPNVNFGSCF